MTFCKGCGEEQEHEGLCDWCYAEQRMACYDERDADDEIHQQALDEGER